MFCKQKRGKEKRELKAFSVSRTPPFKVIRMKNNILGVDVGHSMVKVALVHNGSVVKAASASIPEPKIYAGPKEQNRQIAAALKELLRSEKIHPSGAALALPADRVFIQKMDLPVMKEEEVRKNLLFEFRDLIDGDPSSYVYDYMSVEPSGTVPLEAPDRMYMVGAAASGAYIEEMRCMLQSAGLSLITAAPELAAYKSLIRLSEATEGDYCFVDIGGSATEIYLFHEDSYLTSQELDFGLTDVEQCVAEKYEISPEEAGMRPKRI